MSSRTTGGMAWLLAYEAGEGSKLGAAPGGAASTGDDSACSGGVCSGKALRRDAMVTSSEAHRCNVTASIIPNAGKLVNRQRVTFHHEATNPRDGSGSFASRTAHSGHD